MGTTKPDSWKIKPLPETAAVLNYAGGFRPEEFGCISRGPAPVMHPISETFFRVKVSSSSLPTLLRSGTGFRRAAHFIGRYSPAGFRSPANGCLRALPQEGRQWHCRPLWSMFKTIRSIPHDRAGRVV